MKKKTIINPDREEYDKLEKFLYEKEMELRELYKKEYERRDQLANKLFTVD